MDKIGLEGHKQIMLELMIYLDEVITVNNLKYSLWGGTLLGAVRHKGFIPWDDDIDISLPRNDYDQLMKILRRSEDYELFEFSTHEYYTLGWAKLTHPGTIDMKKKYFNTDLSHGIFVDIIPIDGLPSKDKEVRKYKKRVHKVYDLVTSSDFPYYAASVSLKTGVKKIVKAFPYYVLSKANGGKKQLIKELDALSRTYCLEESDRCGHLLSRYKDSLGYPSTIWKELKEYEFEGYYFKGVADSHTYLSLLYGKDYMEIPSKEKQVTHEEHEFYKRRVQSSEYSDDNGQWQRSENGPEYSKTIY